MVRASLVCAFVLLSPAALCAQGHKATVTGTGVVEINKLPDAMRVQIDLRAKGKTLAEALANLRVVREAAVAKCLQFGAVKESVQRSETVVLPAMLASVPGEEPPFAGAIPAAPAVAVVAVVVKADWPIPAGDSEALLLFVQSMREKIAAADIGGVKSAPTTDATKAKPCDCGCKPGEPVFLFVTRFTEEERNKAVKEAVAKARQSAQRLASTAGKDLDELLQLGGELMVEVPGQSPLSDHGRRLDLDSCSEEHVAFTPVPVACRATATVVHRMKNLGR